MKQVSEFPQRKKDPGQMAESLASYFSQPSSLMLLRDMFKPSSTSIYVSTLAPPWRIAHYMHTVSLQVLVTLWPPVAKS